MYSKSGDFAEPGKIIDAEAFVPRHLEIKAIELKPNEAGDWVEDKVVFNDKISNEIDQSPESYVIVGKAPDFVSLKSAKLETLKKWFVPAAAQAIIDAREDNDIAWTHKLLQEKAIPYLPNNMDGKQLRLDSLQSHIKLD